MAAYRRVVICGHLRADCLYTGIISRPNAQYRVWESLYLFAFIYLKLVISLFLFWYTDRLTDLGHMTPYSSAESLLIPALSEPRHF